MSIESLKKLRIDGYKPKSVHVLVGDYPSWANECADTVCIKKVSGVDFRPLVGLPVSMFHLGGSNALMVDAIRAIESVNPESVSVASSGGVVGLSLDHEIVLENLHKGYSCKS